MTIAIPHRPLLTAFVAALMGLIFGAAMQKSNVWIPSVIRDQFLLRDFTMLAMFLAAAATSAIVLNCLQLFPETPSVWMEVTKKYRDHERGILAVAVGATLLGFGLQISGSCPGTAWVQTGALSPGFSFVLIGAFAGAIAYSFLHDALKKSGLLDMWRIPETVKGRKLTGFIFGAIVFVVLAWLNHSSAPTTTSRIWHPIVAGLIVGLLQIPATLFVGELLGSSQTYVTVSAALLALVLGKSRLPKYMQKYVKSSIEVWWQVVYGIFAVFGAFVASRMSPTYVLNVPVSEIESLLGGFLLVFGSRLAAGCTSGHGISGLGCRSKTSFIAVGCMFCGAITLAHLRQNLGI